MGSKWIVAVYKPDAAPRYVECGLGLGKVKLTESLPAAKRYETYTAAEKIAEAALKMVKKEPNSEHAAVDIKEEREEIPEPPADAEWVTQMKFAWGKDLAAGSLLLQMLKFEGRDWYRWIDDQGRASRPALKWVGTASCFTARASEITVGKLLEYDERKRDAKK